MCGGLEGGRCRSGLLKGEILEEGLGKAMDGVDKGGGPKEGVRGGGGGIIGKNVDGEKVGEGGKGTFMEECAFGLSVT